MNADAEALLDQALKHVLEEQAKILKRDDLIQVRSVATSLNELAQKTEKARAGGVHRLTTVAPLIKAAKNCEKEIDDLSESLWRSIQISVSSIYEKIESALHPQDGKRGTAAELRSHYNKIRIRLLQQSLGAKMLRNPGDRGGEIERVWQQFLQASLGDSVRVLQGGVIYDYEGNTSKHQIDLIVVPAEAHVTFPSGAEDGKVHVPIDQVISAIMVTSTLEGWKLEEDWAKLAALPNYKQKEEPNDHPQLRGHPWPLRYIVGSQSDPIEKLSDAWLKAAATNPDFAPQFVVTLDSGYIYSGATCWPKPRFPSGGVTDINTGDGHFAGLGLAWILLQHQGRLGVIHRRALGPINRQMAALEHAGLKDGMPPTWSPRFHGMFRPSRIAGCMGWGRLGMWPHNKLDLNSFMIQDKGDIFQDGIDRTSIDWKKQHDYARFFRYQTACLGGEMLALEEWVEPRSKEKAHKRIAVFNSTTGEEVFDHGFTEVTDVSKYGPTSWPNEDLNMIEREAQAAATPEANPKPRS